MRRKIFFLIFIVFSLLLFTQTVSAENATCEYKTVFIISDNPGTNILDSASEDVYAETNSSSFNIVVRSGDQVKDMTENTAKNLVITLKDEKGNIIPNANLNIMFNGKKQILTTNTAGQATLNIANNLVPKLYTAEISYDGDKTHFKSTKTVKITVNKLTSKLTAKKATFNVKTKTKKYSITLKSGSAAVKKVKVTLKIKGKTYKATTNAKGKATFKITKLNKKGTFTAKIKFAGNAYYKAANTSVKIKVKK